MTSDKILHGKIVKGVGGNYEIDVENGERISCRARGVFRHDGETPFVGDNVEVRIDEAGAMISRLMPRQNLLIRPPIANLDLLFVMFAVKKPIPVLSTADKLISIAEYNLIEPAVIITKSDLAPDTAEELADIYKRSGFRTYVTGNADHFSENELRSLMSGKVSAFAGASGIGKSTLMNRLFPEFQLKTGEVSRKIERGKHTTRSVELFRLPSAAPETSGYIADTPGFSMLDFERFDFFTNEELPDTFREFEPYLGKCRYTKCTHTKEDGCAIIKAVKDGMIQSSRHESFVEIRNLLKNKHPWDNKAQ